MGIVHVIGLFSVYLSLLFALSLLSKLTFIFIKDRSVIIVALERDVWWITDFSMVAFTIVL